MTAAVRSLPSGPSDSFRRGPEKSTRAFPPTDAYQLPDAAPCPPPISPYACCTSSMRACAAAAPSSSPTKRSGCSSIISLRCAFFTSAALAPASTPKTSAALVRRSPLPKSPSYTCVWKESRLSYAYSMVERSSLRSPGYAWQPASSTTFALPPSAAVTNGCGWKSAPHCTARMAVGTQSENSLEPAARIVIAYFVSDAAAASAAASPSASADDRSAAPEALSSAS
mmetsp:Transcript_29581/g.61947  ORF Transcript_29581/g.61947 Transcript_29581/m.61947 type:complete len:226 (-) Transcript_29581:328-1005(-)